MHPKRYCLGRAWRAGSAETSPREAAGPYFAGVVTGSALGPVSGMPLGSESGSGRQLIDARVPRVCDVARGDGDPSAPSPANPHYSRETGQSFLDSRHSSVALLTLG